MEMSLFVSLKKMDMSTEKCLEPINLDCANFIKWHGQKQARFGLQGVKTGEYERMVFNNEVEENANGIDNPDLIGWEGGQPITLKDSTKLSVGFSGFRGVTDLDIMLKAFAEAAK